MDKIDEAGFSPAAGRNPPDTITVRPSLAVAEELAVGRLNRNAFADLPDRSGVTSQCTYNADGFTRTFRLEANSSTDLKIVPAVPKLDNWNINVTCDNGTSTQTTQFF